jgi:hypothetical protein
MQKLLLGGSLLAIAASAIWIYHYQFGSFRVNTSLHQEVGRVMAEETARILGRPGKIIVVTANAPNAPELKVQLEAFQKNLKLLGGINIQSKVVLDPGDNPKYRPGSGLSSKHLLKIIRKHADTDAIVSFVGAPALSEQDLAQLKAPFKLVAETHSPEKLLALLEKKILVSAIVPRFEFPAPGPRKPQTSRQWFDRYFQVLTPDSHLAAADEAP